ncbi:phosphatidylinositol N-acetylglucosaminyltransferase subunit A [Nematocida sp. AWRm77]|nr:phosphatidylinositol N-acetylglucosaminyltransferase subunit A [Nematocida sp. AWRm77]
MGHRVAMISDFFYPRLGGVENHILNISKELRKKGHTIVVITHANTGVSGVHWVEGFKVYYLDLLSIFGGAVFPTFLSTVCPIVQILLEESIEIVHGHQCTTLAMEGVFLGKMLGLATCFTNHSLVKVNTLGGILTCTAIQMCLKDADQIICVSKASRNNTAERLELPPRCIKVIPNAVTEEFYPGRPRDSRKELVVSYVSRLTFRKGASLLASVLPALLQLDKRIKVVIAGEGNRKEALEQLVEWHGLKERVAFLGGVHPSKVARILQNSDLFLNTSLTDAFCISIIEAAACGLYVVSTNVDGIEEVLPQDMITLTPTTPKGVLEGVRHALDKIAVYDKQRSHDRVTAMYRWARIAEDTDAIYQRICKSPEHPTASRVKASMKKMFLLRKNVFSLSFMLLFFFAYVLALVLVRKHKHEVRST